MPSLFAASTASSLAVLVPAPARVFLSLRVGTPGETGVRDLHAVFQAVDLGDVVEVRLEGSGLELVATGAEAEADEQAMVLRAARAYLAAASLEATGVRI